MRAHRWKVVAAALACTAPWATAQFALKADTPLAMVGGEENVRRDPYLRVQRPAVSRADIDVMGRMLGLSEDQRHAVKILHDGYVAEYMVEVGKLHTLVEAVKRAREARAEDEAAVVREHWDRYDVMQDLWAASEQKLLRDVKALLTPDQVERHWASLERWRRREGLVDVSPASLTQWANLDLLRLLDVVQLTPEERAKVQPILAEYELEVDVPLRARVELRREWREKHPNPREPKDEAFRRRTADIGVTLINTNRRYVRLVKAALGGDRGALIEERARCASYLTVYEYTKHSGKVFEQLIATEDLTLEQREKLAKLQRDYERDLRLMERRHCELLDEWDNAVAKRLRMTAEERARTPFEGDKAEYKMEQERMKFEMGALLSIERVLSQGQRERVKWPGGWPSAWKEHYGE